MMDLFGQHPEIALFIAFLLSAPLLSKKYRQGIFRNRYRLWLPAAGVCWLIFAIYKKFVRDDLAFSLLDAWILLPVLFVMTVNAFIWFVFGALRDSHN